MAFVSEIQHANLRYQDDSLDLEQIMMVIEIEDSASSFAQFWLPTRSVVIVQDSSSVVRSTIQYPGSNPAFRNVRSNHVTTRSISTMSTLPILTLATKKFSTDANAQGVCPSCPVLRCHWKPGRLRLPRVPWRPTLDNEGLCPSNRGNDIQVKLGLGIRQAKVLLSPYRVLSIMLCAQLGLRGILLFYPPSQAPEAWPAPWKRF